MTKANEILEKDRSDVEKIASLLADADTEVVKFISSETNAKFDAQIGLLLAVDQRALAIAGLGAGLAAVGLGAVFATDANISWTTFETAALVTALCSFIGTFICFYACAPRDIYLPGWRPKDFVDDLQSKAGTNVAMASAIAWVDYRIADNDKTLNRNHRIFTIGAIAVFASPIVGAIAGAVHALVC